MQYRRALLLLLPFVLLMQLASGEVIINNTSSYSVSVYDTNTTELIDPLPPKDYTIFNLGSPGPDIFILSQLNASGATSGVTCNFSVVDNESLFVYDGSKNSLMYIIASAYPPEAGGSPSSLPMTNADNGMLCR